MARGGRDAGFLMVVLSVPDEGAGPDELHRLQQEMLERVAPWTLGSNLNFRYGRSSRALADGVRAAHTPDVRRLLAALRASADPAGLFRLRPGEASAKAPRPGARTP